MRIQTDTLKYAKMLKGHGFSSRSAEGLVSTLMKMEINNLYDIGEVDSMLSEAIREVFAEQDQKLAERRHEFNAELSALKNELKDGRNRSDRIWENLMGELASNRRWTIATIITVGLSLATYLSALIHYNH